MKPLNVLALYRARLRARLWQESFAIVGIAAGVALLFASQVATSSLKGSVGRLSRGIAGHATLQIQARDPHGFSERMLRRVRELPGVAVAAPVLEVDASAFGPNGRSPVEIVGADSSLSRLGGTLTRGDSLRPFAGIGAVVLSAPVSEAIGVTRFGAKVHFQLAGRRVEAPLYTQPHEHESGPLATGEIALAPLWFAQQLSHMRGRVSRILVEPGSGRRASVAAGLRALAGGRLNVNAIDHEEKLFANAIAASEQSSSLFAAVSAIVGFLFAFSAMLFTVPQRRLLAVDLRRDGYGAETVLAVLLLDAVVLGLLACSLGLALGDELSIHVLRSDPAYLPLAFALDRGRVVTWQSVAFAAGGGMLAAIVAVMVPLRGVLVRGGLVAVGLRKPSARRRDRRRDGLASLTFMLAASAVLLVAPDAAFPGMALLVAALLLALPVALDAALALVRRLAAVRAGVVAHVAAMELSSVGARAVAVAATGAVAVFGSVAIDGAHHDLLAGLEAAAHDMSGAAEVWVSPSGSYDLLRTAPFTPVDRAKLEHLPGVHAVRLYRGGLLDYGDRRVLVMAPSSETARLLPSREVVEGNAATAARRLRAGGWLVISKTLATEQHVRVGQSLALPSPNPTRFRVAAISTNFGWAPGAILMSSADYARAWASKDVSAYGVLVDRGASRTRVMREIERALSPSSGFVVETAATLAARQSTLSRRAIARLAQIANLIPIVAVLAMAAAIGAMVWQRRPRLAKLRVEGISRVDLWRTILFESVLLIAVGCFTGAIFGLYGQQLADRALAETINFPVLRSITVGTALWSVALMVVTAIAILAVPGYLAASVRPSAAFQD